MDWLCFPRFDSASLFAFVGRPGWSLQPLRCGLRARVPPLPVYGARFRHHGGAGHLTTGCNVNSPTLAQERPDTIPSNCHAQIRSTNAVVAFLVPILLSRPLAQCLRRIAPTSAEPSKRFGFADLQRLRSVQDVHISSDGSAIVYSVSSIDVKHDKASEDLWILRLGKARAPVALLHLSTPAWSPDGQTLAVVNQSGAGKCTVQSLRKDTLRVVKSFGVPAVPDNLVWSPDGRSLAFTFFVPYEDGPSFLQQAVNSAEDDLQKPAGAQWAAPVQITQLAQYRQDGGTWLRKGHRHLFVLSTVDGSVRQVRGEPFDDNDPAWMPDSRRLLFTSDRRPRHEHMIRIPAIYITDMAGRATRLTHGNDGFYAPIASPDGQQIAYIEIPIRQRRGGD